MPVGGHEEIKGDDSFNSYKLPYVSGDIDNPEINGIVLGILEGIGPVFINCKN